MSEVQLIEIVKRLWEENKELNPTETTEAAEATETSEESRVVEKDGEIFISMDTDETDPETDPSEEGQSGEDNQQDQGLSLIHI